MKLIASLCLLFAIIFSVNANAWAGNNKQYGNVIYKIPNGYHQQAAGATMVLMPQGQSLNNAEIAFAITPGMDNAPADLQLFLKYVMEQLEAGRDVVKRETSRITSETGMEISTGVSITKLNEQTYFSIYILANAGGRGELLAVTATNPEALQKYQQQIEEFFSGVSFANLSGANQPAMNAHNNGNSAQARQRNQINQQMQRNYTNQIFLNSITNNYNAFSRSIR
jgi:hypothetical protein